jgi:hypothetical protein
MNIKNRWCRIAWFLDGTRFGMYQFYAPPPVRSRPKNSMYWREK